MREALVNFRGDRTQKEMADRYGVNQQTWSQWELGNSTPSAKNMIKIAKDAGRTVDELFFAGKY